MKKIRASFRKKELPRHLVPESEKPNKWENDVDQVKSGQCSFPVKYLGTTEVKESRGMAVCEKALAELKQYGHKKVKATLWVSADSLRVVDDATKGLVVDQTIEKVSFCAPDRIYERGFSYICRDGTTRRWICHGFIAAKDSGERLSHAVGCAFSACLERKQSRDKLSVSAKSENRLKQGANSVPSIVTDRSPEKSSSGEDSSSSPNKILPEASNAEPTASVPRRHAPLNLLQRQQSCRAFPALNDQSPFKRQLSLRINELPSNTTRRNYQPSKSPIVESNPLPVSTTTEDAFNFLSASLDSHVVPSSAGGAPVQGTAAAMFNSTHGAMPYNSAGFNRTDTGFPYDSSGFSQQSGTSGNPVEQARSNDVYNKPGGAAFQKSGQPHPNYPPSFQSGNLNSQTTEDFYNINHFQPANDFSRQNTSTNGTSSIIDSSIFQTFGSMNVTQSRLPDVGDQAGYRDDFLRAQNVPVQMQHPSNFGTPVRPFDRSRTVTQSLRPGSKNPFGVTWQREMPQVAPPAPFRRDSPAYHSMATSRRHPSVVDQFGDSGLSPRVVDYVVDDQRQFKNEGVALGTPGNPFVNSVSGPTKAFEINL